MALALTALTVLSSVLVAVPRASAALTGFNVAVGQYTGNYVFVPGEVITFTLTGNTVGEAFDVAVYKPSSNQVLFYWDNLTMPASLSITQQYNVPPALPDGPDYAFGVGNGNWLPNPPPPTTITSPPLFNGRQPFVIQQYRLNLDVNRPAYIGGDQVIVTWSANNIKGGGLAAAACGTCGQLWVFDTSGTWTPLINPSVHQFSAPYGTFNFTLRDPSNPNFDAWAVAWYNDTNSPTPARYQFAQRFFFIDDLTVRASVNPVRTAPGGIVTATITTVTQPNRPPQCPTGCAEAGMLVDLTVWQTPVGSPVLTSYGMNGLSTDAHGALTYVFKLDANAPASDYVIRVNASNPSKILTRYTNVTFTVAVAAGLVQVLQLDRTEYQAGDKATVTSVVTGASGTTLTWNFEVRDTSTTPCNVGSTAPLLARATQTTNKLEYPIPPDFSSGGGVGTVCFLVTATNDAGTAVSTAISARVVFGWLLVNADRREYNPKDTITITWDLVSKRITSPSYFYDVRDQNGNSVASGGTNAEKTFQFAVPDPASTRYTFIVTATQAGRTVSNAPGLDLFQATGFFISAVFDRSSYAPGDVMKIHYTITARSANSVPPPYYQISYGLANGGALLVRTTGDASGDLTYTVPQGVNEGDQGFVISDSKTGASASEVVTIRATNPLQFVTVGDIPLLELIILVWLILMTLMMWRKGMFAGMGSRAPKEPAPPGKPEAVHAPATSPMTVTCRSCGSPIEITTSKRPIEVMCPKCGNTEVVS